MCRVLVIDDDKFVRISIRTVLEADGYDVDEAKDAFEGMALQKAFKFDAVIVDLLMPHKDGLETIQSLKEYNPNLPILAISGGASSAHQSFLNAATLMGATATLEKPFGGEELLSTMATVVAQQVA